MCGEGIARRITEDFDCRIVFYKLKFVSYLKCVFAWDFKVQINFMFSLHSSLKIRPV